MNLLEQHMSSVLTLSPNYDASSSSSSSHLPDSDGSTTSSSNTTTTLLTPTNNAPRYPVPEETSHISSHYSKPSQKSRTSNSSTLPHHSCLHEVCAVSKVLEIPELLESILVHLGTDNILNARMVSVQWNAAICTSPALRLHLFTMPQWPRPGSTFQLLPFKISGIEIRLGKPIHLGHWISVSFTPDAAKRIAPHIKVRKRLRSGPSVLRRGFNRNTSFFNNLGSAANPVMILPNKEVFLTQPPILGMQAFIVDPDAVPSLDNADELLSEHLPEDNDMTLTDSKPCAKLWCDGGITLNFLAETAQDLLKGKRAGTTLLYKAIVSFHSTDSAPRRRGVSRMVTRLSQM